MKVKGEKEYFITKVTNNRLTDFKGKRNKTQLSKTQIQNSNMNYNGTIEFLKFLGVPLPHRSIIY